MGLAASEFGGTSLTIAGARTVGADELAILRAHKPGAVIDVSAPGCSIPGAIGFTGVGAGGTFQDKVQPRIEAAVAQLTGGDKTAQIVVMGWCGAHRRKALNRWRAKKNRIVPMAARASNWGQTTASPAPRNRMAWASITKWVLGATDMMI